jgi:CBS domain containing-hemolysin-like protein
LRRSFAASSPSSVRARSRAAIGPASRASLRLDALPEGTYHTAAGLVLALLGRLPAPGDAVEWGGWRLEVAAVDGGSVARIVTRRTTPPQAEEPA